jgi:hypothetical protein
MLKGVQAKWLVLGGICMAPVAASMVAVGTRSGNVASAESCADVGPLVIGQGRSPQGTPWHVQASVEENNGCDSWLLGLAFAPYGGRRGSWEGRWMIPPNGSLPMSFTVSAQDDGTVDERAISGVVGPRVRSVKVVADNGRKVKVGLRTPSRQLQKRFRWLQGLGYFIYYYSSGERVKELRLFDAKGGLIKTVESPEDGSFEAS